MTKTTTADIAKAAHDVAARCAGAYSADRYRNWTSVARALLRHGLDEQQTEAVMCSKWTRWAADGHPARYGYVPARAILDLVRNTTWQEIEALTAETFGPQPY